MSTQFFTRHAVRSLVAAAVLTACGGDSTAPCIALPCPLPIAVTLAIVSSSSATPLSSVFVTVSGAATGSGLCGSATVADCIVSGYSGTYQLDVGAPGFQTVHRTIVVTETPPPRCGCRLPNTQHLDIALEPV